MHQYAHIHCVSKNLYNQDPGRTPISFGVLDPHMVCKMPFCGVGETQQKSIRKGDVFVWSYQVVMYLGVF